MKVLVVDCSISVHERSRTKLLTETFLEKLREIHPDWLLETVNLQKQKIFSLEAEDLQKREGLLQEGNWENPFFDLARQFAAADRIVVAAPCWEMSFPSKLRVYIEHISIPGITFRYTDHGSEGHCRAEKLLFLTSAGGPAVCAEPGKSYLEIMTNFYGIPEFAYVIADMQDVQEVDHETILEKALQKTKNLAENF